MCPSRRAQWLLVWGVVCWTVAFAVKPQSLSGAHDLAPRCWGMRALCRVAAASACLAHILWGTGDPGTGSAGGFQGLGHWGWG